MSLFHSQKCDLTSIDFDPFEALEHGAHGTLWLDKVTPFDHLGQVKSILENPLCPLVRESRNKPESQPHKRAHSQAGFFETLKATLKAPLHALSRKQFVRVLLRDTHYLCGVAVGRLHAIDCHWNLLLFDVQFEWKQSNNDIDGSETYLKNCPSLQTYDSLLIRGENVVSVSFRSRSNSTE
jgi:small nuclear ribonucleoprotein (snRNP)-like protein